MMGSMRADQAAGMTVEEIVHACHTDPVNGLTSDEAYNRLAIHGANSFEIKKAEPLWKKYFEQVLFCSASNLE